MKKIFWILSSIVLVSCNGDEPSYEKRDKVDIETSSFIEAMKTDNTVASFAGSICRRSEASIGDFYYRNHHYLIFERADHYRSDAVAGFGTVVHDPECLVKDLMEAMYDNKALHNRH